MYGKIFKSIYYGSLAESEDARELFICLCAHADSVGFVDMNLVSVGLILRWSRERLEAAAQVLLAPDPNSKTPDEDGRRILAESLIARGVRVVNYTKYREIQSEEDRKEYNARYYRQVVKIKRRNKSSRVKARQLPSGQSGEAEVEVEVKEKTAAFERPES